MNESNFNIDDLERDFLNQTKKINLSNEQLDIINSSQHMMINAVAGSGKSTTILNFALKYPNKNMIQITYNSMLKLEIRKKVKQLNIKNLMVHTYHSLAVNFYEQYAYTDEEIKKILMNKTKCKLKVLFDVLLIDEVQDMMIDYYLLVKKFIFDSESKPQILIFGDKYQGIYDFKGANTKFLTSASKIWRSEFNKMTLNTSFRLTHKISWFINNCMLNYNRINTVKDGPTVDYYICNPYKISEILGNEIIRMIKQDDIKENDIFILSPSIKSENPYRKLENYLVSHGLKCMTPISDDAKLDDKIINNKIVFTTYHQSKGRERKVVILYSFDESYFTYYLQDHEKNICPNILYVGVTRAMHKLILIHDSKKNALPFLKLNHPNINQYVNIKHIEMTNIIVNEKNKNEHKTTVSDLIKFIDSYIMDNIMLLTENIFKTINNASNVISIPSKIKNEDIDVKKITYEDVSDLNGLVIPAIYEKMKNNNCTIENYVENNITKNTCNDIKKYIKKINIPCKTISDFLKIGNIYLSSHNKLHSKLAQIKKYNWLNKKMITETHKNMKILDDKNLIFEKTISNGKEDIFTYNHDTFGIIKIGGRIDAFDDETVYEFKCVDNISIEHKLQLILYSWLWSNSDLYKNYGTRNFKLLNIRTGETIQLIDNKFIITQIVELLLANKFIKKQLLSDDEFINQIHRLETKFLK
jgi:hypothetical protein